MLVAKDTIGESVFDETQKRLVSTYHGRANKQVALQHLQKVSLFYEQNKVHTTLIDLRNLYGSFLKYMDYLESSFYPMAQKSGLRAQALVITDDLIIKNMSKKLEAISSAYSIQVRTFATSEEAIEWLDSF